MIPQANATLRQVSAQGGVSEDMGVPLSPGGAKWAGHARVYYREQVRRFPSDRGLEMVTTRSIRLAGEPSISFERGDVLTFDLDDGREDQTGTVIEREVRKVPGVPGAVRLDLEDA